MVESFSSQLQRLGDKYSLEQLIHEITNIRVEATRENPLDEFSVDERMKWRIKPEIGEAEDGAYCLLGIFGINMPLIYSEGREEALQKLWREVGKSSNRETDIAPFIVPLEQNAQFIGRESELAELEEKHFVPTKN